MVVPCRLRHTSDDLKSWTRLIDATVGQFGRLDIVVNNAANPLGGLLTDVTELAFEKSYAVNVRAPLLLASKALDHLTASGHGVVINMITAGAFNPGPTLGLYCSGKSALWSLTKVMAKEWATRGVRVNALSPGPFETDMMAPTYAIPEFHESIVESTLLKRIASPDEIIGAALYLASDASSYVTGQLCASTAASWPDGVVGDGPASARTRMR